MCLFLGSPAFIGLWVCWEGDQHPPLFEGACGPLWWLTRSHPPWRVTSSSLKLASNPPAGAYHCPMVTSWEVLHLPFLLPPAGYPPLHALIGHHWGLWGPYGIVMGPSSRGVTGETGTPPPSPGLGARGVLAPHSHIFSCLGVSRRMDTEFYRFIMPCHGHTQEKHHGHQFRVGSEHKKHLSVWDP